jgi:hydrogenase maturation protease
MQQHGHVPASPGGQVLVAGIGSRWRGDDAAGLLVTEQLRLLWRRQTGSIKIWQVETAGPELLALWYGARSTILIDAVLSGAPPGTVHRLDLLQQPIPWRATVSSHSLDLAAVVELARVLERLPDQLVLFGIEAESVAQGACLSAAVAGALPRCIEAVCREIATVLRQDQEFTLPHTKPGKSGARSATC